MKRTKFRVTTATTLGATEQNLGLNKQPKDDS